MFFNVTHQIYFSGYFVGEQFTEKLFQNKVIYSHKLATTNKYNKKQGVLIKNGCE
ncbi:hypothetical protein MAH1_27430 [Sessilibacter sp. MAH1]